MPVHVKVRGGRLDVAPAASVTLHALGDGSHFAGRLDDVHFMDTRGTYSGWTLTATVALGVDGQPVTSTVHVVPDDVVVVNGFNAGLQNPGPQDASAPVTLARSTAGCGAGIYSVSATFDVELSDAAANGDATLSLDLHLT